MQCDAIKYSFKPYSIRNFSTFLVHDNLGVKVIQKTDEKELERKEKKKRKKGEKKKERGGGGGGGGGEGGGGKERNTIRSMIAFSS